MARQTGKTLNEVRITWSEWFWSFFGYRPLSKVKLTIMEDPSSAITRSMYERHKNELSIDFVKEVIKANPRSDMAYAMWGHNKDRLDVDFVKEVIKANPRSDMALAMWRHHKEVLLENIDFVKEVIKANPGSSSIALAMWRHHKEVLLKDIDFVKEFITANPRCSMASVMWEHYKTQSSKDDLVRVVLEESTDWCTDFKVLMGKDIEDVCHAKIMPSGSCGMKLCAELPQDHHGELG